MPQAAETSDLDAIRQLLDRITAAWTSGRFDDLAPCFHEAIVLVPPGFAGRVEGREACIQSYRDFMEAAKVTAYRQDDPSLDLWGDTAVATYRWEMAWELDDRLHREAGHDCLVLTRHAGRWQVAWRTLLPASSESA